MKRQPRPPGKYFRSKVSKTPARVIKTKFKNREGFWLYRLDYGAVRGNQMWTLNQLTELGRFLQRKPSDL